MPSMTQKLRILKYTAEQSVVTIENIISHLGKVNSPSSVRVVMYRMGVGRMKYGEIKHGIWFLKQQKHLDELIAYFPDMHWASLNLPPIPQVPHSLELNHIRNLFEKTSNLKVCEWVSEASLRGAPPTDRDGFDVSNIPDAVFWRQKEDQSKQKYFLEYERSLKNPARYKDIFTNYMRRNDTGYKNVIYICKDKFIRDNLLRIEEKLVNAGHLDEANKYFQFVTLNGFYKTCGYQQQPKEEETIHENN